MFLHTETSKKNNSESVSLSLSKSSTVVQPKLNIIDNRQTSSTLSKTGVFQLGKKDTWRTGARDGQIKAAKTVVPGGRGIHADTGHHKMAKSKLKKLYLHLDAGDKTALGIDGPKGLMSLPSNLTFGPNSANRSDDPGSRFDANYTGVGGPMTPRSANLHAADQEFDRGKLSHLTGAKGGFGAGALATGLIAGAGYMAGATMATLTAPVLTAAAAGIGASALLGYWYGSKKKRESDTSKGVITGNILAAEGIHGARGFDTDLGIWRNSAIPGKVEKRK